MAKSGRSRLLTADPLLWAGYTDNVAGIIEKAASSPVRDVRFQITTEPLDVGRISEVVSAAGCGAVATFVGLVRDHNMGRRVLYLDYECYEPLAVKAFARIAEESLATWPDARLAIAHRMGRLQVGDASVVVAASSPHRADAFAVCRYAIERVKQIVPIWKHEHFEGGEVWIEGATADAWDDSARAAALERACT